MKCSVFIATSADGFIARADGSVDWLDTAGKQDTAWFEQSAKDFNDYITTVDCMIMGRKTMDILDSFNLSPEQWPYGDLRIIALSRSIKEAPDSLKAWIEMYSGDLTDLLNSLEKEGHKHAYIDGGSTIQAFLNLKEIDEMTITRAPVLIGDGVPLFGRTAGDIKLEQSQAVAYASDFVQVKYKVNYE